MFRYGVSILVIAGLAGLAACTSTSVVGPSGSGGIPGGIPSPGGGVPGGSSPSPGGGIPSPGGGIPSPGGGIPTPGDGIPSPGGGIPTPGDGSAGLPGGSGDGAGSGGGGERGASSDDGGDSDVFGRSDDGTAGTGGGGGDDEFDRALGDFDDVISEEQEAIARESGQAADEPAAGDPGTGVVGGADGGQSGERAIIGGPTGEPRERTAQQVEGCNDQDTVARQLCEAATLEQDPFLRAALWDEYNEYKRILGRL